MTRDTYVFLGLVLLFAVVNGALLPGGVVGAPCTVGCPCGPLGALDSGFMSDLGTGPSLDDGIDLGRWLAAQLAAHGGSLARFEARERVQFGEVLLGIGKLLCGGHLLRHEGDVGAPAVGVHARRARARRRTPEAQCNDDIDDDGCGRPATSLVSVNVTFTTND